MSILRAWGDDIWTVEGDPIRFFGAPFGTRMTVARLSDGSVWLHSPVAMTDERRAAIETLGPVRHLVAPNMLHHLFVQPWLEAYPDATTWAAPKLAKRRPDLTWHEALGDQPPAAWAEDIDQLVFGGSKVMAEVLFFHRRSGTLIITDILQNHEPEADNWFWRTLKRLGGILAPNGGAPADWRLTVRDKATARAARDRMLAWPFEQVVISHGRCLTDGARAHVERAFAWLG